MNYYRIIKTILYVVSGIVILILNEIIMNVVGYVVGSVILVYGLDLIVKSIETHNYFGEDSTLTHAIIHMFIGIILFIVAGYIAKICIVWAVWSILREGRELTECFHRVAHRRPAFINITESIIIIVLSFMMVLEPTEHHAHVHIILLGVELILEVMFPIFNNAIDGFLDKRKKEAKLPDNMLK